MIGVLDGDVTKSPIATMTSRTIMADSAFTRDVGSMWVDGDVVIWSSNKWKVFYVGKLNEKGNFLGKRNIHVLDSHLYGEEHEVKNNVVTVTL